MFSVSVAGVVVDPAGRVLAIQRRDTGAWQIPGGQLEETESIQAGLRREVREETRVEVSTSDATLTGIYRHTRLSVVALVFRCVPLREKRARRRNPR